MQTQTKNPRAAMHALLPLFLVCGIAACGGGGGGSSDANDAPPAATVQTFIDADRAARDSYGAEQFTLQGKVVDPSGAPLTGVTVTAGGQTATTEQDGAFTFADIRRGNLLLGLDGVGLRAQVVPVSISGDSTASPITIPTVVAAPADGAARILFAGDTSFGRRFIDPNERATITEVPAGDPSALIQADDPLPGSRAALSFVAPWFEQADYPVVNFESPILTDPATPHPTKDFVFFSLPGSLPALKEVGVDYVSLGNNHVYDYLSSGLQQTLAALDDAQITYSGAGGTPDAAFAPYRFELNNQPFSLLSATSVSGSQHDILYVADDTQGGAADLRDDVRLQDVLSTEAAADRFVIAQLHTGKEYLFSPSQFALGRMRASVAAGADLVVAHHPHVAQGISYENGVLMYHGLGNFLFDQDRHETMLGLLAQVDVSAQTVARARALPIYLEDYRPRPIVGALASRFLRRISEFSFTSAAVVPYLNEAWIAADLTDFSRITRNETFTVTVPASGVAIVDLRSLAPAEFSLSSVAATDSALNLRLGRDILLYGDFEDYDVDPERLETARWNIQSSASFTCQAWRYRGAQGLCLTRSASNQSDTVVAFRNRVRVMGDALNAPNKDLSLVAYVRGENAGAINIVSRYYPSAGDGDFGEEAASHPGGTFDWQLLFQDLNMPADRAEFDDDPTKNPRALRLFIRHSPMQADIGLAAIDEIAVVNWEESVELDAPINTPHARDFVRVEAAPGSYELTLEFDRYLPTAAQ